MARKQKQPAVVAELGRPETPAETAARKANDSRLYRQRKTVNNLVFSLLVSLGLVLVMVLVVPRGTGGFEDRSVDVAELAEQYAPTAGRALLTPDVPEGWKARQAEVRGSDGVTYWQINYTTADEQYAAVVQAFTADGSPVNETWIAEQLERRDATGAEGLGGLEWTVYDHSDRNPDETNVLFGMQGVSGENTLLVYGTDAPGTLRALAAEVAAQAEALPRAAADPTDPTPTEETP
ncbi:DUF4245 domain-containing protein [Leucobacter sp. CSA1]|uniref:DUF4245 domain-containing protein n=1 Tax=Leucobacter chromiisoli TaxID=2796471 RepID=A0A934Q707_9MICO|nr:DUF4245 family protein [Leucobacter chromiisoli]MBK0417849.1 DUF4245 domain-containing protein [Leucobacter chromiisoli]